MSYTHTRLSSLRAIRIFQLDPGQSLDDPIEGKLMDVSLDESPYYCALSYTWGPPIYSHSISIADQIFMVTENCFAALKGLRLNSGPNHVWIDSICIDQNSLDERNIQVALMDEIYARANGVLIWIGEWDNAVRGAIQIIKEITGSFVTPTEENAERLKMELSHRASAVKAAARTQAQDGLHGLFNRPWFSRMWTVQEVVLASRETPGKVSIFNTLEPAPAQVIPWGQIMVAVDALRALDYLYANLDGQVGLQQHLATVVLLHRKGRTEMYDNTRAGNVLTSRPSMWTILIGARAKQAGDIKDKVFALYGIFKGLQIEIPPPDYAKPVRQIYQEATIATINHDRSLNVLFEIPSDSRDDNLNLPSWVPDLSDPGWRASKADSRVAFTNDRFCAAGPSDSSSSFEEDRLRISVKFLDTVDECGPSLDIWRADTLVEQRGNRPSPYSRQTIKTLRAWVSLASRSDSYPTNETSVGALSRTLSQDSPEAVESRKTFDSWYQYMRSPRSEFPSLVSPSALKGFHPTCLVFMASKAFFVTEGGYMGTAPSLVRGDRVDGLVKQGDRIALVAGLCMPIILRPTDSTGRTFRWITHCYLHGVMYGEGWENPLFVSEDIIVV